MKKINTKLKRKIRNRKKIKDVNRDKLRITVYKSKKNISAQIIEDNSHKPLVSASSTEKELKNKNTKKMDTSNVLGEILAKRALDKKFENKELKELLFETVERLSPGEFSEPQLKVFIILFW